MSHLGRLQPREPTDEAVLDRYRRDAWKQQGVAILWLSEIEDDWVKQVVTNEANRLYGPRERRGEG